MRVYCDKCGKDITETMKIRNKNGCYCYDCYGTRASEQLFSALKNRDKIKVMYLRGTKPTEIAKRTGLSVERIYEILSDRAKFKFDKNGNIVDAITGKIVQKGEKDDVDN